MDKTFAETQGHAPFDWNTWLDAAIAETPSDKAQAIELAEKWATCACGNQCAIIPRAEKVINNTIMYRAKGAPMDRKLYIMGCDFLTLIEDGEYIAAKELLQQIEARSAILISEELAKFNSTP